MKLQLGKIIGWTVSILVIALAAFIYVRFFYVFGDGVKAGELNQFALKGYVFKTYEGRLIMAGFRGGNLGAIQYSADEKSNVGSYVFDFSVTDPKVADQLMRCSGKQVELHYKQYLGVLPWRGMDKHIVDRVISVREPQNSLD